MTKPATWKTRIFVVAVLATLAAPTAAYADPAGSKRAQADAVMAQIQMLDASVGVAVEQYNAARIRLDEIRGEQRRNRRHLAIARASYARAQRALEKRLHALYTSDSSTGLEIILGAASLSDLLARLDTVDRVSSQDARVVHDIRGFRTEVKRREAELREAAADQEAVVAELAAKRREIEAQLAERRRLLASISSENERCVEEERLRQ